MLEGYDKNFSLDFATGKLTMKKGSINIGDNFIVDEDGNLTARRGTFYGSLVGVKGTFNGTIQAEDYLDSAGQSMIANGKFKADYLELMGIKVKNQKGDVVLTIDQNGLRFGGGAYSPIQYQFSADGSTNWHDEMSANDKYRRDSLDGGTTWGDPYQFKGTDGSDANVPSYITRTKITETTIESPKIYGAEIHGAKFFDYGGGFSFMPPNGGSIQWGSITYEENGINIGAVDGIALLPGTGNVTIAGRGQVVDTKYLKDNPIQAVFA